MAIELKVPEVGESITEVEIGEWLKSPGDQVRRDEPVVSLESEKATVELAAPEAGVLGKILKNKGAVAKVGEVIGYLEKAASSEGKLPASTSQTASAEASKPEVSGSTEKVTPPRVMPSAQALLQKHGLQPEAVEATGPGGRLLKEDVLRHINPPQASAEAPAPAPETPSSVTTPPATS